MKKIKTIIRKEWAEVFKNRMVMFTVILLPLIMTAIPLAILYSMRGSDLSSAQSGLPPQMMDMCPKSLTAGECLQVYMVDQFMLMFMILPAVIPATIAAYSIVGEKTTHSLEPLLATPITTVELLAGKALAAAIPAIGATYAAFGIFFVAAALLVSGPVLGALFDARWLIAVLVLGPLIAIMAVSASVMVSSRVNDPRVAEQLSMVVIVPVMAMFFGQIAGVITVNKVMVISISIILAVIDAGLIYLAVGLFQRETILTRWK